MDHSLAPILARHEAFWRREPVEKPLMSVSTYSPLSAVVIDLPMGYLRPEQLRVQQTVEECVSAFEQDGLLRGDIFMTAVPYGAVPWMEAIVGCPLRVNPETGSMWAEPVAGNPNAIRQVKLDEAWLAKFLEYTAALAEASHGRFPISQSLMRGPIDMFAALLGDETACVALLDEPEASRRLLSQLAYVYVDVARRHLMLTPKFHDGYVNSFGIWAPGTGTRTQADNGALLSPKTYREFLLPLDDRIARSFDYSLIHLHSGWLHFVDELLTLDSLKAIQVSVDPYTRRIPDMLPVLQRILAKKPLIVTGAMTQAELDLALAELPAAGLYLGPQMQEDA